MEARKFGAGQIFAQLVPENQNLDTVRALHQTVVALRVALEKSRAELQALRVKVQTHIDTSVYVDTIEKLSLENHILRQRVLNEQHEIPHYIKQQKDPSLLDSTMESVSSPTDHMESTQSPTNKSSVMQEEKSNEDKASNQFTPPPEDSVSLTSCNSKKSGEIQKEKSSEGQASIQIKPVKENFHPESVTMHSNTKDALNNAEKNLNIENKHVVSKKYSDNYQPQIGTSAAKQFENDKESVHSGPFQSQIGTNTAKQTENDKESMHSDKYVPGLLTTTESMSFNKKKESSTKSLSEDGDQSGGSEESQDQEPLQGCKTGDSDNESEEVDDIELIFTTEETKELGVMQEDLVPIADSESWHSGRAAVLLKFTDPDQFDSAVGDTDDKHIVDTDSTEKMQSCISRTWMQSVLVETDISKCGVLEEVEVAGRLSRRNTMPAPLIYQPVIHRETSNAFRTSQLCSTSSPRPLAVKFAPTTSKKENGRDFQKFPIRPILMERNAAKRESEAQTDITALPSHWKSESYLVQKVAHNLTTLPSKFALPIQQTPRSRYSLKLTDKTREARRTLLSDINFTSMVPELSRSADHLCQDEMASTDCSNLSGPSLLRNYPRAYTYMKNADFGTGSSQISPGYNLQRQEMKDAWSPCNCNHMHFCGSHNRSTWDNYQGRTQYRGSLTSIPVCSPECQEGQRRHSWKPDVQSCSALSHKRSWGSVPSSPTHSHCDHHIAFSPSYSGLRSDVNLYSTAADSQYSISSRTSKKHSTAPIKLKQRNRVTFEESVHRRVHPGQSLPDLRSEWDHDSGDSTDSLIDEAEEYLRRSIDSMLTGTDWSRVGRRRQMRRYSEPDTIREFVAPQSARPFLPKIPRDLKSDYLVKVITTEGRVMIGRVRYVGTVSNRSDPHVGVELPKAMGDSDGTFQGVRYFDCDTDCAMFVPFKKVVMAWSIIVGCAIQLLTKFFA